MSRPAESSPFLRVGERKSRLGYCSIARHGQANTVRTAPPDVHSDASLSTRRRGSLPALRFDGPLREFAPGQRRRRVRIHLVQVRPLCARDGRGDTCGTSRGHRALKGTPTDRPTVARGPTSNTIRRHRPRAKTRADGLCAGEESLRCCAIRVHVLPFLALHVHIPVAQDFRWVLVLRARDRPLDDSFCGSVTGEYGTPARRTYQATAARG
jgi:hypothetical protein